MMWLGEYPEDFTTVTCMFSTHDSNGANVAPLSAFEADDIRIYKNGNAAQKTTTNGITMTSPFDSLVGFHCVVIDTSNDTGDGGFWVAGAIYTIVLAPDTETVNGQTITGKVIGQFGLELAEVLRPVTAGRQLDVDANNRAAADMQEISGDATAADNLETMLDGTGGQTFSLGQLNINNSSGSAIVATSSGSNGHGAIFTGNGSGEGISTNGGATGHGFQATGGATSGDGINASAMAGNGSGFNATGHGSGHGIKGTGGGTTGSGIRGQANTSASGDADGASFQGAKNGAGMSFHGGGDMGAGTGNGPGIYSSADGTGAACQFYAGPNSVTAFMIDARGGPTDCTALETYGKGAYPAWKLQGGATGPGVEINGGATSGAGIAVNATLGDAVDLYTVSGDALWIGSDNGHAIVGSAAGASKNALNLTSGASTRIDSGTIGEIQFGLATASALATVDTIVDAILINTDEIGVAGAGLTNINLPDQTMNIIGDITGNLSGSVGSVTTLDTAAIVAAINAGTHDGLPFTTILQKLSALLLRDAVNLTTDVRGYKNGAGDIVMEVTFTDLGDTRTTNLSP